MKRIVLSSSGKCESCGKQGVPPLPFEWSVDIRPLDRKRVQFYLLCPECNKTSEAGSHQTQNSHCAGKPATSCALGTAGLLPQDSAGLAPCVPFVLALTAGCMWNRVTAGRDRRLSLQVSARCICPPLSRVLRGISRHGGRPGSETAASPRPVGRHLLRAQLGPLVARCADPQQGASAAHVEQGVVSTCKSPRVVRRAAWGATSWGGE